LKKYHRIESKVAVKQLQTENASQIVDDNFETIVQLNEPSQNNEEDQKINKYQGLETFA